MNDLNRRKRETGKSGEISEEMINEMIDLMNKLNENFGKVKGQPKSMPILFDHCLFSAQVVSHYDLRGKGKEDMAAGEEDEEGEDEEKSMKVHERTLF